MEGLTGTELLGPLFFLVIGVNGKHSFTVFGFGTL
jgi:hypothetical protein